jgi:hypothetical protein
MGRVRCVSGPIGTIVNRAVSASIEEYVLQEWGFGAESDSDTSAIARMIAAQARSGNWLDLGCGPMLAVWPMFHDGSVEISGLDRNTEIAKFHSWLSSVSRTDWPLGLMAALAYAQKFRAERGMTSALCLPIERVQPVVTADILTRIGAWSGLFDTVIQIGCFGCLDSIDDLHRALSLAHEYLNADGVLISATWIPRPAYTESVVWGGDNLRSLDAEMFIGALQSVGLEVLALDIAELDHPNYRERFVVAAKKKPTGLFPEQA